MMYTLQVKTGFRIGLPKLLKVLYLSVCFFIQVHINAQAPTITAFSPASGSVGTLVTITGTNLNSPTGLSIGGVAALPIRTSATQVVAMVMPGATTGVVSVTTGGGTANATGSFTVLASQVPNTQQGSKLVGTGAIGAAYQGVSVSISADGNTAVVGGWLDNGNQGAVWVYTRTNGVWTQQGSKLVGTGAVGGARQGFSVSISADGNTVIVGGYGDNGNQGAAWIFTRTNGVWTQQGNKLVGTGAIGAALQGLSVSISADGNTAIIGGYNDNSSQGAAWVFTRSGGMWTQQGNKLIGTGAVGDARQGYSVSLSADGNTAIVGAPNDNGQVGAVWIFTRINGIWTQQGNKLVGTGAIGFGQQGYNVSLSADGNTAIVGGYTDNSLIGAAWIFTRSGNSWTQQGSKLVGTGATGVAYQGYSVSLSADGNTAIMGGFEDNTSQGAAWIFARSGNSWTQQGSKLVGTGATVGARLGVGVSLSADGNTAIIGGSGDNSNQGAAWVFTTPPVPTITSFSPVSGTIGSLVTITGTNLNNPTAISIGGVAAIPISNTGTQLVAMVMPGATSGVVTVTTGGGTVSISGNFTVTTNLPPNTQQGNKLVGIGAVGSARQGHSVAISADGNTAAVGGIFDSLQSGAVWIFVRNNGSWLQQAKLKGSQTSINVSMRQGKSVALSADGNTVLIGGNIDGMGVGGFGAAWVFTRTGNVWTEQTKLTPTGGGVSSLTTINVGNSVAISADGNTALVAGTFSQGGSFNAVWVFTRNGNTWTQQGDKLIPTETVGPASSYVSVAISGNGNTILIGRENDNSNTGGAWVFTRAGGVWSQQGGKLLGTGAVGAAFQGVSVALSADGNTAAIGGYNDNNGLGAVWVFTRSGNIWTQQGAKVVGTGNAGTLSYQGATVALNADGNTLASGGYLDPNTIQSGQSNGSVWIFTRSGNSWVQRGDKLVGAGVYGSANQGFSIGLSADGNTLISGGDFDSSQVGAAWIFYGVPKINVSGSLVPVHTTYGTASLSPTSFTISGTNLSNDIIVTPPNGYEVSTNAASGFTNSLIIAQSNGILSTTTVFVRLRANAAVTGSPYSGNIVCSSSGATSQNVATVPSSVGARALTIIANNANKTYGQTLTNATGSIAFTSSGLQNSETIGSVSLAYGTGSAATSAVGTYTGSVTPSAATGGTFAASNYNITYSTGNIIVGQAALTITANNANKTYGQTLTNATGSTAFTSSGLQNSETIGSVSLAYGTGAAATAAVGTYTGSVTPSAATGGTFTASNYNITYSAGNIVVGQAALTITANNANKTYGQTLTNATGSTAFTSSGLQNSETIGSVSLAYGTGSAATAAVGTYTGSVTPSAATGGTFTASNYNITYSTGNIIVGQAALTITATNAAKTYGTAAILTQYTTSGLVNSDAVSAVTLASTGSAATAAVGTYPITAASATGTGLANYTITYTNGTLTVNPAALTITATNAAKAYGTAATLTQYTTSGLVNSDAVSAVALASTGAAATASVGTYSITAASATGTGLSNYTITYTNGILTVNPTALTITASNAAKTYGAVASLTQFTTTGLVNSDAVSTVTLSSTGSAATSAVGTYPITAASATGTGLTNYTITYNNGTLTVNPAALTITASSAAKTYGAAATLTQYTTSGLVNADAVTAVTLSSTGSAATAAVGTYPITAASATGTGLANYTITYNNGTLTVNPATLTITANNQNKCVGDLFVLPASGFTVVGIRNTDNINTVALTSAGAVASATIGTYPINVSNATGTGLTNYQINYVAGTLTVNALPAKPIITWNGSQLGTATGLASYQWLFNNSIIGGATNNTHTPLNPGSYRVRVANSTGCADTSLAYDLVVTALPTISVAQKVLTAYPNPVINSVNIDIGYIPRNLVELSLVDMNGKVLNVWRTKQRRQELLLSQIPAGTYTVKLQDGQIKQTIRIIKQ